MTIRSVLVAALGLLLLSAGPASAHPHVWVEASLDVEMEEGKVTGFAVTWLFDDFYSDMVRNDFDRDGDRALSEEELDALVGVSAVALMGSSFFTHMRVGDEQRRIAAVEEFYAEDDGVQILYRFRVPLSEPVDPTETEFSVGLFDEGYYVDIAIDDAQITVADQACRMVPKEALDQPLYYGIIYPTYYHLVCGTV